MKALSVYLLLFAIALCVFLPLQSSALNHKTIQGKSLSTFFNHEQNVIDTDAMANNQHIERKAPRPLKVFNIYPNPANRILYVRITGKQTVSLRDEQGCLIFKTAIREKAIINITPLPAGIYSLTDEKTGATKEVVISR
ncbi:MAG: T9SS type A sorting domain-containing protein [Panacibacter sp.]